MRSDISKQTSLRLADSAEAVLFGCTGANVTIGGSSDSAIGTIRLGILNSVFVPGLELSVQTVQPTNGSGTCGVQLAGERLCDARALCEGIPSGGVKCACVGNGLRYKTGVPQDGRQCEQDASLRAVLESESLAISVSKPSNLVDRTLTLIVEAHGETQLAVAFDVTMTRLEASSGAVIAANGSIRVDQPSISAFGQHIEWKLRPPEATWCADLDGSRLKFADTSRHEFAVRLTCDPQARIWPLPVQPDLLGFSAFMGQLLQVASQVNPNGPET
jgi:hypothetical protein